MVKRASPKAPATALRHDRGRAGRRDLSGDGPGNSGAVGRRPRHRARGRRRARRHHAHLHGLPGDARHRTVDLRAARRQRLPATPRSSPCSIRRGRPTGSRRRAARNCAATASRRRNPRQSANARIAARTTPKRSAASARRRARRCGAAAPAPNRSTASNVTERAIPCPARGRGAARNARRRLDRLRRAAPNCATLSVSTPAST